MITLTSNNYTYVVKPRCLCVSSSFCLVMKVCQQMDFMQAVLAWPLVCSTGSYRRNWGTWPPRRSLLWPRWLWLRTRTARWWSSWPKWFASSATGSKMTRSSESESPSDFEWAPRSRCGTSDLPCSDSSVPSAIDGVTRCGGSRWERFKEVAQTVIQHEITWERIALLFYVAGRLAVKVGPEVVPLVLVLMSPVGSLSQCLHYRANLNAFKLLKKKKHRTP